MERTNILHSTTRMAFLAAAASLLTACAGMDSSGPKATATLEPRSGSTVSGTVSFQAVGQKVRVEASVAGLTPGEHGFHVHEVGDCSAADATSATGHFNPAAKQHGHHGGAERHAGDMPNLVADSSGKATFSAELDMLSLTEGPNGILKRSVVIHADPDDFKSQPAGNSGKRVACGVIRAAGSMGSLPGSGY
jgi:Cu-Zn family superoxide dismutase